MKKKFPDIRIDSGFQKVYSLDLSGGGTDVSTLTLSFLDTGQNFELSTQISKTVTIGSFYTFKGYVVAKSKRQGMSGKIIELTLVDQSIILDQIYIGLKGKHGLPTADVARDGVALPLEISLSDYYRDAPLPPSSSTTTPLTPPIKVFSQVGSVPPNLILLGSAVDPCKDLPPSSVDRCNPCGAVFTSNSERIFDCRKNRAVQILDVDYSFNELLNSLGGKVSFAEVPTVAISYRAQHTGSLRDVLNAWCQEIGYSFYYDSNTSNVVFFRPTSGIQIKNNLDSLFSDCIIEDKTETNSIQQNERQINIAYFGKDGEWKDYDCSEDSQGGFSGNNRQGYTLKPIGLDLVVASTPLIRLYNNQNFFKAILAAGAYNKDFRDLFCWNKVLNFTEPAQGMIGKKPLMGWNVKAVCYKDGADQKAFVSEGYTETAMSTLYNHIMNEVIPKNQRGPYEKAGAYLIVAEEYGSNAYEFEKKIIENYGGKYFYAGISSDGSRLSSPDGQLRVFNITSDEAVDRLFPDLMLNHKLLTNIRGSIKFANNPSDSTVRNNKIVLLNRSSSSFPEPTEDHPFLEDISKVKIQDVDFSAEYAGLKSTDRVFLIPAKNLEWELEPITANHPGEILAVRGSNLGLKSATTDKFTFKFKVPSRSNKTEFSTYLPVSNSPYTVSIEGSENKVSFKYKTVIPKLEVVLFGDEDKKQNYLRTTVNYIPITDVNLGNLVANQAAKKCYLDENKIKIYGQSILKNFTVEDQPSELITISYSLFGIPSVPLTPKDGLVSFSIKMDSSGTRTNLSFSNKPPLNKSIEYKKNELKYLLNNQSTKSYTNILR